jgi:hypothetical protein
VDVNGEEEEWDWLVLETEAEFKDGLKVWIRKGDPAGTFCWEWERYNASGLVAFGDEQMSRFLAGRPVHMNQIGIWFQMDGDDVLVALGDRSQ